MKKVIGLFSLLLYCGFAYSQKIEGGVVLGFASYKGELNPMLFDSRFFSPAAGGFYRYNINHHFSIKGEAMYGSIYGDDSKSENEFEKNRNLSFRSELLDVSVHTEFNFFPYEIQNRKYPFSPYVFIGLGIFKFNPKGYYTDPLTGTSRYQELQPLGTEGQGTTLYPDRKEYSLTQICIPFGGGLKINVGGFGLGLELGARKTFTDYLDDVSLTYADKNVIAAQNGAVAAVMSDRSISSDAKTGGERGNANTNDWYLFGGVTVYFRLDKIVNKCDPFHHLRDPD